MRRTVIQCYVGELPNYLEVMKKETQDVAKKLDYGYEFYNLLECAKEIVDLYKDNEYGSILASDHWRLEMAFKRPDMIYLDVDCILLDEIPFGNLPAHGFFNGQPEWGIFSVNGFCDFYKNLFIKAKNRNISLKSFGWPAKVLRDEKVDQIVFSSYIHTRNSYLKMIFDDSYKYL